MGRDERRAARLAWPGRKGRLGDDTLLDPDVLAMSPSERVALVWRLTLDAWAFAGWEIPRYARHEMPARIVRGYDRP